ncbi:autotransporter outer membrane beta-barrel domain-containing protein [Bartonella pachyuromydis]|uniref:Autotransporter domain-containing protein n=1 Tax=Bartonella pachyuromydis TaxID=931097 RepID=A0ABP8VK31_9HYPH
MINILRGYSFLFTVTAIVSSFVPVVRVGANSNNLGDSCNVDASFYICSDGRKHIIKNKTYNLSGFQEDISVPAFFTVISVENAGTVVNASKVDVTVDHPNLIGGYGVYVGDGGKLVLTNSSFKNIFNFNVKNAVVRMEGGAITGVSDAIYVLGEKADIAFVTVNVQPASDNSNIKGRGFVSGFGAFVRMSDSTVTFNEIGGFLADHRGRYLIDTTNIQGKGKEYTVVVNDEEVNKLPVAFDISQGSHVYLRDDTIQLTDMHGFLITNFSGYAYENGELIQEFYSSNTFKNTILQIKQSNISVQGEGTYGFYFVGLDPNVWADMLDLSDEELSKTEQIISGVASVSLSGTTVRVPDGIAIYSTGHETDAYGAEATIELSSRTNISGDLLVKAENNSSLLVKVDNSILTGGIRVEDISTVKLELTRDSTWNLTKSKHMEPRGDDYTDSYISSVNLSNSTIVFDHYSSPSYQTLRIGSKSDISQTTSEDLVYSATGNVQIKLSAFVNDDGSLDPQKTDRILIYGSVSGTTLLQLEGFSKVSEKSASGQGNLSSKESISLVQVFGTAQEDSFKFVSDYIVMNGLPYQYHLRVYGPSSHGKADTQNRLVSGSGNFWDFRLESVYVDPKSDSSESVSLPLPTIDPTSLAESVPTESLLEPASSLLSSLSESDTLVSTSFVSSKSVDLSPKESVPAPSIEQTGESIYENSTVETMHVLPISSSVPEESPFMESASALPEASGTQLPSVAPTSTPKIAETPLEPTLPLLSSLSELSESVDPLSTDTNSTLFQLNTETSSPSETSDQVNSLSENSTSSSRPVTSELSVSSLSETSVSSTSTDPTDSSSVRLVSTKISITSSNSTLSRSDSSRSSPSQSSEPINSLSVNSTSASVLPTSSSVDTTPMLPETVESLPESSTSVGSSISVESPTEASDQVNSLPTNFTSSSELIASELSRSSLPRESVSSTSDVPAKFPSRRLIPTKISITSSNSTLSRSDSSRSSPSQSSEPINSLSVNSTSASVLPTSSSVDTTPILPKTVESLPESSTSAASSVSVGILSMEDSSALIESSSALSVSVETSSTASISTPSASSIPVNPSPANSTSTSVSPTSFSVNSTSVLSKDIESPLESSTFASSVSVETSSTASISMPSASSIPVNPSPANSTSTSVSPTSFSVNSTSVLSKDIESPLESSTFASSVSVETSSTASISTPSASTESSSARSDSISSSSTDSHSTLTESDASTAFSSELSDPVNSSSANSASISISSTSSSVDSTSVPSKSVETLPENSLSVSSDSIEPSSRDSTFISSASSPSISVDSISAFPIPVKPDVSFTPRIRAVVPQLPTYLLLPNALFYTGLIDFTSQNKKLEEMRNTSDSSLKGDEKSAFFVRGYGGSHHYAPNLSAFEYGYGGDFDYNAIEAGAFLKGIESLYSRTSFGLMGTYGSLSLYPQAVQHGKKSLFNKWSIAGYGNLQHDTGVYMDGVFSYGLFRGDVFTLARGKAATLKGKQFSASLTSGKAFTMGHKMVVFDPQVQLVYQHLQFDRVRDVDHIDVDLGKFSQWTGRIGARLSKTLTTSKIGRVASFYSMLYFSHSFGDRQFVSFKKDFQLSDFGFPLEVGLGFNARLSPKFVLHGDIIYQHRLTKAGFSGASFSAGLRHLF